MNILFVCNGNTYRSRLAEAYLKSLKLKSVKVMSSGIHAGREHILVRWYAEKILERNNLVDYVSKKPRQTAKANLKTANLIVFFEKKYLAFAKRLLNLKNKKIEIFAIKDINLKEPDKEIIKDTKKTFTQIKHKVNKLVIKYGLK